MTLHLATYNECDAIYAFGEKFFATLDYEITLDKSKGLGFIKAIIDDPNGLALILNVDDQPVGCLVAFCQEHPFAPLKIASELIWWVEPEYRGGRGSMELFNAYEYWAVNRMGARIVSAVATPGNDKLQAYYKRKGYEPKEITHMKDFH